MIEFLNQIIHGDCITIMRQIPDESIDMTFADPPFNLSKRYGKYKDDKETQEYLDWCYVWLDEMARITKPTGSIFVHNIPKWLPYFAVHLNEMAYFRHWIAWDAMSTPVGKTLLPAHYGILFYTKSEADFKFHDLRRPHERCRECNTLLKDYGGKKYLLHPFGTLLSDVWTDIHRIRHQKRRDKHPCQLPEPLLERLIMMVTNEGDVVLDPFIGAGTTALAAKRLGRQYIGIDVDEEYIKIAKEKLVGAVPLCQPVVKFMEPKGYVYQYKSPQKSPLPPFAKRGMPFEKGEYNKTGKNRPREYDNFALNHTVRDDQFEFDTTRLKKEHRKMMTQKENQKAQLILFENYREYSVDEQK